MEDLKNPILSELFDEIEELNTSLRELSNDDLIECKTALINRTNIVGLHFKIVVNKDNAKKLDFCIA